VEKEGKTTTGEMCVVASKWLALRLWCPLLPGELHRAGDVALWLSLLQRTQGVGILVNTKRTKGLRAVRQVWLRNLEVSRQLASCPFRFMLHPRVQCLLFLCKKDGSPQRKNPPSLCTSPHRCPMTSPPGCPVHQPPSFTCLTQLLYQAFGLFLKKGGGGDKG
jgi:hypothetical protein